MAQTPAKCSIPLSLHRMAQRYGVNSGVPSAGISLLLFHGLIVTEIQASTDMLANTDSKRIHKEKLMKDTRPFIVFDGKRVGAELQKAVYARLREFGKSFWIVGFQPWIHPYNKVKNCVCLTLDGSVYYKFQIMMIKGKGCYHYRYRVAEVPRGNSFIMDVKKGQRLSHKKLLEKIATAQIG